MYNILYSEVEEYGMRVTRTTVFILHRGYGGTIDGKIPLFNNICVNELRSIDARSIII